jgi:hypothetical protein
VEHIDYIPLAKGAGVRKDSSQRAGVLPDEVVIRSTIPGPRKCIRSLARSKEAQGFGVTWMVIIVQGVRKEIVCFMVEVEVLCNDKVRDLAEAAPTNVRKTSEV